MQFLTFERFCRENKIVIFTLSDFRVLFREHSPNYLRLKLKRWKEKGYLWSPKRGLYILAEARPDEFEIAAKLITPSYISLESALSHYSIIPEVSAGVTAVTTKNTRVFDARQTVYRFYHIKQGLFCDFGHLRNEVFIATPEKAVLDFFYFRKPDESHPFFERINREAIKGLKIKTMQRLAQKFPWYTQKLFNHFSHVITR